MEDNKWSSNFSFLTNILFGLVLSRIIVENRNLVRIIITWEIPDNLTLLAVFSFLLPFTVITSSWIGYHKSLSSFGYKPGFLGFLRTFADSLILFIYYAMLYFRDENNIVSDFDTARALIAAMILIFAFYQVVGILRMIEWRSWKASKWYLITPFWIFFAIIYVIYPGFKDELKWLLLSLALVLVILYRVIRFFYTRVERMFTIKLKKPSPIKLGIDIDGTIAQQVDEWLKHLNDKGKAEFLKVKDVDSWYFKLNGENIADFFKDQYENHPEFALKLKPIKDSSSEIKRIRARFTKIEQRTGIRGSIIYITARHENSLPKTEEWLKKHGYESDGVKSLTSWEKSDADLDIMIEDNPKTAIRAANNGIRVILLSRPYNRNLSWMKEEYQELFKKYVVNKSIIICKNWKQIGRTIYWLQSIIK